MKKAMVYIITVVLTAISTILALDAIGANAEAEAPVVNNMADVVYALTHVNNYATDYVIYEDGEVTLEFSWNIIAREYWDEAWKSFDPHSMDEIEKEFSKNYRLSVAQVREYVTNWHVKTCATYRPYYCLIMT